MNIATGGPMGPSAIPIPDDFREAYHWFRQNTHPKAKLMAWWDYGYQVSEVANRTVLVDNNTWNSTHIASVGLAFASEEFDAYAIAQDFDVDYVFVVFGGMARFASDDINKLLWMVRITSGVYPRIQQSDFLDPRGQFTVGRDAPNALKKSLMYKLSYHRFGQATKGLDFARKVHVDTAKIQLKYFEEAYTTENWVIRIYKVRKPDNRDTRMNNAIESAFQ